MIVKRVVDFGTAAVMLLITLPLLLLVSLVILLIDGRPLLFTQIRIGMNEKPFIIYKLRTMSVKNSKPTNIISNGDSVTRLGQMLRFSSIDEMPQLWNIINGDMSLIGPRPLLPDYLPLYTETQRLRHAVRPGITGLAQVKGRNLLSWRSKFRYDVFYVNHVSWKTDVCILALTLRQILKPIGISGPDNAAVAPFTGNVRPVDE